VTNWIEARQRGKKPAGEAGFFGIGGEMLTAD
jgi:hypothetical protein